MSWAGPGQAQFIFHIIIIINPKKFQGSFQNIYDFTQVFSIILYNIRLYIIIRYKSDIKISGILQNISLKIKKNLNFFKINFI